MSFHPHSIAFLGRSANVAAQVARLPTTVSQYARRFGNSAVVAPLRVIIRARSEIRGAATLMCGLAFALATAAAVANAAIAITAPVASLREALCPISNEHSGRSATGPGSRARSYTEALLGP